MNSAKRREKTKNRKETGRFAQLPHVVLNSADYISLSYKSKALLVDLVYQYNGKNNGDLTAALEPPSNLHCSSHYIDKPNQPAEP